MSSEGTIMVSTKTSPSGRVYGDRVTAVKSELAAHLPALTRHARRLTKNPADADDLVQECVLRALSKIEQFEPGTNLKGWLSTILTNIFIEGLRRKARHREFLAAYALGNKTASAPNQLARLEFIAIDNALGELPAEQRTALIRVAIDRASYSETAQKAGVALGTIRSRVSRARQALATSSYGTIRSRRPSHYRFDRALSDGNPQG